MKIYRYFVLGLALIGLTIVAEAQNPPSQNTDALRSAPAPALSGIVGIDAQAPEEDLSSNLPQIPAMLGGKGTSLAFQSEMERSNYLRGGLNVGAAYDDNALLGMGAGTNGTVGNTSYSVFSSLAIEQSWSRARWTLAYAGGLTVNQRITDRNQGSHDVNFDSQFRLSPHVNLRIAEDFAVTTGFFDGGSGMAVSGTAGPNASLITPLATQRTNSTTVAANYHYVLNDMVGGSGSFYDLHFTNPPAGSLLVDTRTASGSAFWMHRLFGRNWAGGSYNYDHMTFEPMGGETQVHSISLVDTLTLPQGFSLNGFLGPQYSDNSGTVAAGGETLHFRNWNIGGGVEVGWQGIHTSVAAGFSRRVTDGGGVLGAVRSQSVHGNVRRQLLPKWAVALGASYGNNKVLTSAFTGSGSSTINVTSVSASLERNVGRSLGLGLGYSHDFQQQSGYADATQKVDEHRNRFFVTLSYQWAKPLGM